MTFIMSLFIKVHLLHQKFLLNVNKLNQLQNSITTN